MREFAIVSDSCSDLGADLRKKWNIDYVPMRILMEGKDLPATLDWVEYTPKYMYDVMRNGGRITTAMVPVETFKKYFTEKLEEGKDVLYVACSSGLSASVNIGAKVAEELLPNYPGAKIYCVDSLNASMGEGLQVVKAAELRAEGKTIDQVKEYLEAERLTFNQFASIENLDYLKRAGRVKASAAFFGNLFGVKPILISDVKGMNAPIKKVKGRKNSFIEIVNQTKENIIDAENQMVCVTHSDCIEDAETIKEMLIKEVNPKEIYINYIGPTVGASTGPGTVAIYFKGKKVSE
ncbi:MAG: DegV family protein [Clostridia bacterium]|nr:DegV family protein [Clostridia bacterium]